MNRNKLYILIISACMVGYILVGYNYPEYANLSIKNESQKELCIFKNITHVPCPSCGTTISVTAIAHGNISQALWWNPMGIIMFVAMILFPLWIIGDLIAKNDSFYRFFKKVELIFQQRLVAVLFILWMAILWSWNIYKYI